MTIEHRNQTDQDQIEIQIVRPATRIKELRLQVKNYTTTVPQATPFPQVFDQENKEMVKASENKIVTATTQVKHGRRLCKLRLQKKLAKVVPTNYYRFASTRNIDEINISDGLSTTLYSIPPNSKP